MAESYSAPGVPSTELLSDYYTGDRIIRRADEIADRLGTYLPDEGEPRWLATWSVETPGRHDIACLLHKRLSYRTTDEPEYLYVLEAQFPTAPDLLPALYTYMRSTPRISKYQLADGEPKQIIPQEPSQSRLHSQEMLFMLRKAPVVQASIADEAANPEYLEIVFQLLLSAETTWKIDNRYRVATPTRRQQLRLATGERLKGRMSVNSPTFIRAVIDNHFDRLEP